MQYVSQVIPLTHSPWHVSPRTIPSIFCKVDQHRKYRLLMYFNPWILIFCLISNVHSDVPQKVPLPSASDVHFSTASQVTILDQHERYRSFAFQSMQFRLSFNRATVVMSVWSYGYRRQRTCRPGSKMCRYRSNSMPVVQTSTLEVFKNPTDQGRDQIPME